MLAKITGRPHGPYGGDVRTLIIDPKNSATVYAGTFDGGVFKSTNGGASWEKRNSGLTNLSVFALSIDPNADEHSLCRHVWWRHL